MERVDLLVLDASGTLNGWELNHIIPLCALEEHGVVHVWASSCVRELPWTLPSLFKKRKIDESFCRGKKRIIVSLAGPKAVAFILMREMVWFITRNSREDLLEDIQSHICKAKYWEGKPEILCLPFYLTCMPPYSALNKSGMVLIKGNSLAGLRCWQYLAKFSFIRLKPPLPNISCFRKQSSWEQSSQTGIRPLDCVTQKIVTRLAMCIQIMKVCPLVDRVGFSSLLLPQGRSGIVCLRRAGLKEEWLPAAAAGSRYSMKIPYQGREEKSELRGSPGWRLS